MVTLSRLALLAALSIGSTALAQTTTGTTTGSTSGTSSGPAGSSSTPNTGFTGTQMEGAPTISGGGATGANVNSSNILAGYYANPLYAGRPGSTGTDGPGGFGTALAGGGTSSGANRNSSIASRTTGTSGRANTSSATGTTPTGRTSTTGSSTPGISGTQAGQGFGSGFGGTTGTGTSRNTGFGSTGTTGFGNTGFGNTGGRNTGFGGNTMSQQQGIVAPASRSVAYSVKVRIPTREITPAMMTNDLNVALARSTALANPGAVNASYDGKTVVLRGQVKDADEAKLAESIIRLTPGVRVVQNELTYPKQ